jgi:hypothetical protein
MDRAYARMEEMRNAYIILIGDLERKRPLGDVRLNGRMVLTCTCRGCELNSSGTGSGSRTSGWLL